MATPSSTAPAPERERPRTGSDPGLPAPGVEPRETSGITSRLVLQYLEKKGGRAAVDEVLRRSGLAGREADLRDENQWFSYEVKIRLFEASAAVLDDPLVMRHVGETALEHSVAEGLKVALRALGTPRLVYQNVVRANAKFNTVHRMEIVSLERDRARIRFADEVQGRFHPLDCDYNIGLLSCVPALFGQPLAHVSHPLCVGDGAEACVYDVLWDADASALRFALAAGALGAAALGGILLAAPALLPVGIGSAAVATAAAAGKVVAVRRRRWSQLEREAREQSEVAERLAASLQDLAGELRLEEVLEKITRNVQGAVSGKEFALLVRDDEGSYSCRSSSDLPAESMGRLERWLGENSRRLGEPLLIDDVTTVPELGPMAHNEVMPLGSLCAAPLLYRGRFLGALVALANTPRAFLPRDLDLLRSYATQAAIALTNARLFQEQEELASRDPLTGLLNHREFHETVEREIDRCRRHGGAVSIVLFDLDGFKLVNDAGGHAEGDRVLGETAGVIQEACRASDLAFRVGGDEFAVVLPAAGGDDATEVAERASAAIREVDSRTTASFGVASYPENGDRKDDLLEAADRQLYAMKWTLSPSYLRPGGNGGAPSAAGDQHQRLAVANRLSAKLSPLREEREIAQATVAELHGGLGYDLAVVHRLDDDGMLRAIAGAGPLVDELGGSAAWEQSVHEGVTGRAVRTAEPTVVPDTSVDPDYISLGATDGAHSELALPIRVGGRIWGVLNIEAPQPGAFGDEDLLLADTVATQVGAALHRGQLFGELEGTFMTTLEVLCDALEEKDPYTAEHTRDVADLAERVGRRLELSGEEVRTLRYAALLHDIGKIGVRTEVLNKPGPLTNSEFEEIKQHTVIGARMLERIPFFARVQPLVRSAHERWDGEGYPDGSSGEAIPLGARVIGACDAFMAMISDRPYRAAMPPEEAIDELRACAGTQFDPAVVEAVVAELEDEP
jgi:diguanylate cyclase (GGDEF)-like protein/putative nucleotidyltransferase with HDIG domain